jgi:hypothetical protein
MVIYKTRWFDRWARKQNLGNRDLCKAVHEMKLGLFEADLGGGLLKKRVARHGEGKSGGYRAIVATNKGSKWFFVFGFAKSERSNIDKDEEVALKKLAGNLLALAPSAVSVAKREGELKEVDCDA